jgi:iron-sulfur cluster repair protein YtfE (RIC family)
MTAKTTLDIERRTGWPPELRVLLDRHPRASWPPRRELAMLARFWLDIHDGFRGFAGKLRTATLDFREDRVTPARFREWFAPRVDMFLSHLEGHHLIEDNNYFPLFAAGEPRLARGFDVLESDHRVIHVAMDRLTAAAQRFLRTGEDADGDAMRFAGEAYAEASNRLLAMLDRHLTDEEDLIVPLILERGEADLGL